VSGVDLAFGVLAVAAVASGWRVFRTDSMVRASFLLLASFLAVGGIALLLAAPYLGAAIVFMMAVEMMVMALFMVMFMMNPAGLNPMNMVHQPRFAAAAGALAAVGLGAVALVARFPADPVRPGGDPIAVLGRELLGGSMLVFESAGVAIVAAMVGAVVLSGHRGRYGAADEGSQPPPLTPGGEPAAPRPDDETEDAG
jgi:NADH:ubiquinone oxidoreductase subunit 6 (subunit J)